MRTSVYFRMLWISLYVVSSVAAQAREPGARFLSPMKLLSELDDFAETRGYQLGRPNHFRFTPDGTRLLFLRSESNAPVQSLFEYDLTTKKLRELPKPAQLLTGGEEKLTPEEKARRERLRLSAKGYTSFDLSADGETILVPLSGRLFTLDRKTGTARELPTGKGSLIDPKFAPNGKAIAYVLDQDIYVMDLASGKESQVTRHGSEELTHGVAEFVAMEEMDRFSGYWWSPDSQRIVYQETDHRPVEVWYVSDLFRPGEAGVPQRYPRPGKNNVDVRLGLISIQGGNTTWIDWDRKRYPYLTTVSWQKNAPLTLVVQDRKQQEELVLAVDPANGKTKPLLSEKDDAWIKIDQDFPHWLEDGSGFLWITERAGGPAVELRKADGSDPRILVPPSCGFRGLIHIDEQRHRLYFQASTDPSQIHLHYVSLKGGGSTALTGETDKLDDQGEHSALFAPKGDVYVHVHASPRNPVTALLRSEAGGIVGELPSIARKAPFVPHVEFVKVGEGEGIYCSVTRPRKFDSAKKYPVIVDVYGGPGHLEVRQVLSNYILPQIYADQGFIVVAIDNRGTPGRGRAWERAIRGNFAKHTLEDQVAGLQALGKQFPEIDLNRVGIVGWSFGGYMSALAVLRRPDLFKAAVAGAPVVDWQDYDTHYTERYLGLPKENKKGYEESNLLTYAKDLKQPLLLVHGTGDDNVFFLHTLKLSNALFRQGKDHEVLPLSGLSHMVRDPLVRRRLEERIIRFFQKHL